MKWYTIFCGEDFSNHSVGFLYENFDGDDFSMAGMVDHAQQVAKEKAWLVLSSVEINPDSHQMTSIKLFENWNPLKKKIVLDPKKGKGKKKTKNQETLEQLVMAFQNQNQVASAPVEYFQWGASAQGTIVLNGSEQDPDGG